MSGEPILIVDDNAVNLKLARILCTLEGYEVRTATNAEEALRVLQAFHPRLIPDGPSSIARHEWPGPDPAAQGRAGQPATSLLWP